MVKSGPPEDDARKFSASIGWSGVSVVGVIWPRLWGVDFEMTVSVTVSDPVQNSQTHVIAGL